MNVCHQSDRSSEKSSPVVEDIEVGSVVDGVDALFFEIIQRSDLFQVFGVKTNDAHNRHQKTDYGLDDYIAGQTFELLFSQPDITSVLSRRIRRMQ